MPLCFRVIRPRTDVWQKPDVPPPVATFSDHLYSSTGWLYVICFAFRSEPQRFQPMKKVAITERFPKNFVGGQIFFAQIAVPPPVFQYRIYPIALDAI